MCVCVCVCLSACAWCVRSMSVCVCCGWTPLECVICLFLPGRPVHHFPQGCLAVRSLHIGAQAHLFSVYRVCSRVV